MAELKDALSAVGLDNPQTLLQSGNVVVDSNADTTALIDIVETTIQSTFGFQSTVIVRTADEFRVLLANHPFTNSQLEDGRFAHVGFCRDQPDRDGFESLQEAHEAGGDDAGREGAVRVLPGRVGTLQVDQLGDRKVPGHTNHITQLEHGRQTQRDGRPLMQEEAPRAGRPAAARSAWVGTSPPPGSSVAVLPPVASLRGER
jgi:hypothetical protein